MNFPFLYLHYGLVIELLNLFGRKSLISMWLENVLIRWESTFTTGLLLLENTKHPLANLCVTPAKGEAQKSLPWEKPTYFSSGSNVAVHLDLVELMEISVSLSDGRRNRTITDEHAPRKQDFSTWLGRLIYFPIFCFMHSMSSSVQKLIIRQKLCSFLDQIMVGAEPSVLLL